MAHLARLAERRARCGAFCGAVGGGCFAGLCAGGCDFLAERQEGGCPSRCKRAQVIQLDLVQHLKPRQASNIRTCRVYLVLVPP